MTASCFEFQFSAGCEQPYFKYAVGQSRALMLVFCPVNTPPGQYPLLDMFHKPGFDVLSLNCEHNLFYLNGVPGLGNLESSLAAIADLVSQYAARGLPTFSVGSSMGATGALHYGVQCGASLIFSSGLTDDIPHLSKTYRVNRHAGEVAAHVSYPELLGNYQGHAWLVCGDQEMTDFLSLLNMPDRPNIRKYVFSYKGHCLFRHLHRTYGLGRLLTGMLEGRFNVTDPFFSPTIPREVSQALYLDYLGRGSGYDYTAYWPENPYEAACYGACLVQLGAMPESAYRAANSVGSTHPSILLGRIATDPASALDALSLFLDQIDASYCESDLFLALGYFEPQRIAADDRIMRRLCEARDRHFPHGRLKDYLARQVGHA